MNAVAALRMVFVPTAASQVNSVTVRKGSKADLRYLKIF